MKAINLFCNTMIILGVYLIVFTDIQQKQVVVEHQPLDITIQIQPEKVSMVLPEPVIKTTDRDTFVHSLNQCVDHIYKNLPE